MTKKKEPIVSDDETKAQQNSPADATVRGRLEHGIKQATPAHRSKQARRFGDAAVEAQA